MPTNVGVLELQGKRALVTGAARGIGRAIAGELARAGALVMINDLEAGEVGLSGEPGGPPLRLQVHAGDVSSASDVHGLFDAVGQDMGGLDVLVNNAGVWFREPLLDISEAHWDRVFGTVAKGSFLCLQAAARLMAAGGGGSVVNVASQAGLTYTRGQGAHYHAAKAAVIQLTRAAAFELGPMNIRVNAVAPGYTETEDRLTTPSDDARQRLLEQTPLGRPVQAADIAAAVTFLCSERAGAITGQTLLVNGGAVAYL